MYHCFLHVLPKADNLGSVCLGFFHYEYGFGGPPNPYTFGC